jgi:hypothetical protein
MRVVTIALAAALATAACDIEGSKPGVRSQCAVGAGPLEQCERVELLSPEDACWRLVECGSIPVANPEAEPDCCFDWARCVDYLEELPDPQLEQSLACLEVAPCDSLKWNGSPNRPNDELPPCLAQGD